MSLLSDIGVQILSVINGLLTIYSYIVIIAVFMSWLNPDPYNQIVRTIRMLTEPALRPFRRLLWPLTRQMGIDLSPILLFLGISIVQTVIRHAQNALYQRSMY